MSTSRAFVRSVRPPEGATRRGALAAEAEPSGDVFRAIADPTRRLMLDRLRLGPSAVNELAAKFPQSRPAISKHLRVLREAGLVRESSLGRERIYELVPGPMREVAGWLEGYRHFWQVNLARLKSRLEAEE